MPTTRTVWSIRGELPSGCIHHSAPLDRVKALAYLKFRTRPGSSGIERTSDGKYRLSSRGVRAFDLEQNSSVHLPSGYRYKSVQLYGITRRAARP